MPNGLRLTHLSSREELELLWSETLGPDGSTYLSLGVALREGDTVLDVGSNIGLFSLKAAQVGIAGCDRSCHLAGSVQNKQCPGLCGYVCRRWAAMGA